MKLTDPEFIKRLESLCLLARQALQGKLRAERQSREKGRGIVFADYSEYKFGDDYRSIDWQVYARLEQLIVKLFEIEQDTDVCLLLDCSQSMAAKFALARQLAAALGYIALSGLDRVGVWRLTSELQPLFPLTGGRGQSLNFLRALEESVCQTGGTDLAAGLRHFQSLRKRRSLCILISDFFSPGYERGLQAVRWAGHDLFCLQLLAESEITTRLKGEYRLTCVESGDAMPATVTPKEAALYAKKMREWNERVAHECLRLRAGFARAKSTAKFDEIVRHILRRGGLVG